MSDRCIQLTIGWVSHLFSLALRGSRFLPLGAASAAVIGQPRVPQSDWGVGNSRKRAAAVIRPTDVGRGAQPGARSSTSPESLGHHIARPGGPR
jgi:hypothetical protein